MKKTKKYEVKRIDIYLIIVIFLCFAFSFNRSGISTYALESQKPTSGMTIGDKCFVSETNTWYQAISSTTWGAATIITTDMGAVPTSLSMYSTPTRTFTTNYTPNVYRSTFVIATFRITNNDGDARGNIDVLVGGNIIANAANTFNVTGLLGVGGSEVIDITVSFFVQPNTVYRFNNAPGAGNEEVIRVKEITF